MQRLTVLFIYIQSLEITLAKHFYKHICVRSYISKVITHIIGQKNIVVWRSLEFFSNRQYIQFKGCTSHIAFLSHMYFIYVKDIKAVTKHMEGCTRY